jgi:hypothetical protein
MLSVFTLAAAILSASPAAEEWPRDTTFHGPSKFCGWMFAANVTESEQVVVRDGGLDFLVYYFEGGRPEYTIYEGNHPQRWDDASPIDAGVGRPTTRMWKDKHASYLVEVTDRPNVYYLHIMSPSFDGSNRDLTLLGSLRYGDQKKTGCAKPTYTKQP